MYRIGAGSKFHKRGQRYVRHRVELTDFANGTLYFREVRDILAL